MEGGLNVPIGWAVGGAKRPFFGPVDAAEKICEKFWRESEGDGAMIHEGPSVLTRVTAIRRSRSEET